MIRLSLLVLALFPAPLFAYLDPGTGSILIQGLIGLVAAGAVAGKVFWHKISALFRRD